MVSKVEREQKAIAAAETELAERKKNLEQLKKDEAQKQIARLAKKVGHERTVKLLELAVEVKPDVAIAALEKASAGDQGGAPTA